MCLVELRTEGRERAFQAEGVACARCVCVKTLWTGAWGPGARGVLF